MQACCRAHGQKFPDSVIALTHAMTTKYQAKTLLKQLLISSKCINNADGHYIVWWACTSRHTLFQHSNGRKRCLSLKLRACAAYAAPPYILCVMHLHVLGCCVLDRELVSQSLGAAMHPCGPFMPGQPIILRSPRPLAQLQ